MMQSFFGIPRDTVDGVLENNSQFSKQTDDTVRKHETLRIKSSEQILPTSDLPKHIQSTAKHSLCSKWGGSGKVTSTSNGTSLESKIFQKSKSSDSDVLMKNTSGDISAKTVNKSGACDNSKSRQKQTVVKDSLPSTSSSEPEDLKKTLSSVSQVKLMEPAEKLDRNGNCVSKFTVVADNCVAAGQSKSSAAPESKKAAAASSVENVTSSGK
jgi:hypothetical protein